MQIPEGYSPIPSSRKGGFRRRNSSGAFDYWYPGDPAPGPAPTKVASKPKDPRPTGTPDVHLDGETVRHVLADHPEARGLRAISANPLRARHAVRDLLGTHKFIEGDGDSSGQLEIAQMSPVVRKRMAAAGVGLRARTAWE